MSVELCSCCGKACGGWCERWPVISGWKPAGRQSLDFSGIEQDRWGKGIPHDPRSIEIVEALVEIDFHQFDDHFSWKTGGDGDNGESLMYELDMYFELKDKGRTE